jgi:hypothetical protein
LLIDLVLVRPLHDMKMLFVLSGYLICLFLYRVFVPAHEYDSRTLVYLTMGLDVIAVAALIWLRTVVSRDITTPQEAVLINTLFVFALLAGLGLLVIRMLGKASWWTGHLHYELLLRR